MSADDATRRQQYLARLRREAEAAGSDHSAWTRYISALLEQGLKGRARKAAKSAPLRGDAKSQLIALSEQSSQPGAPLADLAALIRGGKLTDARRLAATLLKQFPEDAKLLNLLGVAALSADDPVDAEGYLRRALSADPASADAVMNLGLALVRQGRGSAAITLLEPLAKGPDPPLAARVNLVSAYLRADRPREALDVSIDILKDAPGDPETVALRAQAHLALGQGEAALETLLPLRDRPGFDLHDLIADAIERFEGRAAAMLFIDDLSNISSPTIRRLATLLAEWGELERASVLSRGLAENYPDDPTPFRMIGTCGKWSDDDPLIPVMARALKKTNLSPAKRGSFGLALAKAQMDVGDDDAAIRSLVAGNAQLRKTVSYDVRTDLSRFREIAATWTAEAIRSLDDGEGPEITPVFIVGLPRSGSTLMETILSRHPRVTALGETPFVHTVVHDAGNEPSAESIRTIRRLASGFMAPPVAGGVTTDKLLSNFLYVGALAAAFPHARFIEAKRDLRANGLSLFQTELNPLAHPFSTSLEDIAHYSVGYTRLMDHWARVVGSRLYRASYETLVADPATEVPVLVDRAGLKWDDACLGTAPPERRINTFSVAQARKPITTASVARWTRYEQGLKPLIDILENEGVV